MIATICDHCKKHIEVDEQVKSIEIEDRFLSKIVGNLSISWNVDICWDCFQYMVNVQIKLEKEKLHDKRSNPPAVSGDVVKDDTEGSEVL
jgi:hypothetical protein